MLKAKGHYKITVKTCVGPFKCMLSFNSHIPKTYSIWKA